MDLVDFILNLAALLSWINWRTAWKLRNQQASISITGAIKKIDPQGGNEWTSLATLLTLLLLRAVFYWYLGPALKWVPTINLVPVSLVMRSDLFPLMLVYSFASFGLTLGLFYSWLLLLSVLNSNAQPADDIHRFVRMHLGFLDRINNKVKIALPLIAAGITWICCAPVLKHYGILPPPVSKLHLLEQAFVIALSAMLGWRGLLLVVLATHIINTYLFLGNHSVWAYVNRTATNLLGPLKLLRWGVVDIGSLLLLSGVIVGSYLFTSLFTWMFASLPW